MRIANPPNQTNGLQIRWNRKLNNVSSTNPELSIKAESLVKSGICLICIAQGVSPG